MCLRETLRSYKPDFDIEVDDLGADEVLSQYLFLASGLADEMDTKKRVSLGLSEDLKKRKDDLHQMILQALLNRELDLALAS